MRIFPLLCATLLVLSLNAQDLQNPNYNDSLAKQLGADDYGMKSYHLVLLKTGNNTTADKAVISESFKAHMQNIVRLVAEEKMIVAGPLGKNELNYRGIFIFQSLSPEQILAELEGDLAIKNQLLEPIIIPWYGSAALPTYLPNSDLIWKVKP